MNIIYVALKPPKGAQKANGRFPSKIVLYLKKVCYKVTLCKYCQRRSCKAFTGLSIRAKMARWGRPLLRENLTETGQPAQKRRFPIVALGAPQPSEISSVNMNIFTEYLHYLYTSFPMNLR